MALSCLCDVYLKLKFLKFEKSMLGIPPAFGKFEKSILGMLGM
tara:strand:+ start:453 stop:581 length:129 start_codon:yes stop_codon:yes gene_type:complete